MDVTDPKGIPDELIDFQRFMHPLCGDAVIVYDGGLNILTCEDLFAGRSTLGVDHSVSTTSPMDRIFNPSGIRCAS